MSCAKHSSLSVSVSPLSPHPPHPGRPLIRLLAVILLVGVTIVPILVFLGEVGLGAQRRQREEAGAGADRGQRRRLQPHGQWGQRQGQSLQLGQLMGLELLLQGRQEEVVSCLGPPTSPRPPPASLPTCPPAPPPAHLPAGLPARPTPRRTRMMEFSSGAVTCLALSMAPKTCCWCWKGVGTERDGCCMP